MSKILHNLNKPQTAVEWLISKVNKQSWGDFRIDIPNEIIEQAKQMEKERMIEFTDDFWFHCVSKDGSIEITPEQYYNETYGNPSTP
jgi:hypothetical protein